MADSGKFGDDIQRYSGILGGDWYSPIDHDLTTKCNSWLVESIRYVVNRVKQTDPNQLWKFCDTRTGVAVSATTADGKGSGYAVFNHHNYGEVLHVYKQAPTTNKRYMSRQIDRMIEPYLGDTNSIYYATLESPAHYITGDNVVVFPSHGSGAAGFIQVRYDTTVTTTSDSISYFPDELNILPILHTASQVINYKLSAMRDRLPDTPNYDGYPLPATAAAESGGVSSDVTHDVADGVAGASLTHDPATAYHEGWNAVRWYIESEEDVELASAKMQELTAEQQLFVTDYQWLQGQSQLVQQEFEQRFGAVFGVVGGQ